MLGLGSGQGKGYIWESELELGPKIASPLCHRASGCTTMDARVRVRARQGLHLGIRDRVRTKDYSGTKKSGSIGFGLDHFLRSTMDCEAAAMEGQACRSGIHLKSGSREGGRGEDKGFSSPPPPPPPPPQLK